MRCCRTDDFRPLPPLATDWPRDGDGSATNPTGSVKSTITAGRHASGVRSGSVTGLATGDEIWPSVMARNANGRVRQHPARSTGEPSLADQETHPGRKVSCISLPTPP